MFTRCHALELEQTPFEDFLLLDRETIREDSVSQKAQTKKKFENLIDFFKKYSSIVDE
jgi:hypothetical protein